MKTEKTDEKKEKEKAAKEKEAAEKIEDVANDVDKKPPEKGDPPVIDGKIEELVSWREYIVFLVIVML